MQNLKTGFVLHGKKDYTIQEVLGDGGYGILYHATSKVMDGNIEQTLEYAIKEYFDKDCCRRCNDGTVDFIEQNEEIRDIRDKFRVEANCLMNLKYHKNIVQVNEVFENNGTFYYVMEFLKGKTLGQRQRVMGKMPEKEVLKYIADIADALDYLHSEYINHLDVKPDNIMVVGEGDNSRAVLIDFGLSKHFDKNGKLKGKQAYDGATQGYAPKEQQYGIDEFSPQTDVYALAATMLSLLTGIDLYDEKEITKRYIWNNLPSTVSERTGEALVKAMNPNSDERTQSIKDFRQNLFGEKDEKLRGPKTGKLKHKRKVSQSDNGDSIPKWLKFGIIAVVAVLFFFFVSRSFTTETPIQKEASEPNAEMVDSAKVEKEQEKQVEQNKNEDVVTSVEPQQNTVSQPNKSKDPEATGVPQPVPQRTVSSGTLDLGYAVWKGGIKNGKPDGVGKMTFRQSHRLDSETMANSGDFFDGSYTDGHIDGGKLHRTDGEVITIIGEN